MGNKIVRQGIDKTAQAHRGLLDHYQSFFQFKDNPYPFSLYHGVSMDVAWKLIDLRHIDDIGERMKAVAEIVGKARYHRKRWAKGGRNSGKTMTAAYTFLALMVWIENNLGVMLRHNWRTVETTMMLEFEEIARMVTDGHPEYLLRKSKNGKLAHKAVGYYTYTIFTRGGLPSRVLVLPEPDESDPRAVADALKSPQGGLGAYWIDELSETREVVDSTLEDNMRRQDQDHAGLATTNPFHEGTWGYRVTKEEEERKQQGKPARVLILESSAHDNPFAEKQNIKALEEKYENDPVGYRLNVLGKDVRPVQGVPVCKDHFFRKLHVNPDLRINPAIPLYVGLDWGFHHPAAVFTQPDRHGRWGIYGEIIGEDWDLRRFSDAVFTYLKRHYPAHYYDPERTPHRQRNVVYWCDPAGAFQSERGNKTVEEFDEYGIICNWREDSRFPEMRADIIRKMLRMNVMGRPMLQVHPRCEVIIDGLEYGWHYRVQRSGKKSETPNKDGFFEHPFDALGYLFHGEVGHTALQRKRPSAPLKAKGPTRKVMP